MSRVWILRPSDTEMAMIDGLLREAGERVEYALDAEGRRVTPATAYRMAPIEDSIVPWGGTIYCVECAPSGDWPRDITGQYTSRLVRRTDAPGDVGDMEDRSEYYTTVKLIDHHRPGDPGYGQPPEEFLPASSIGQVVAELARLGKLTHWRRHTPVATNQHPDARPGSLAAHRYPRQWPAEEIYWSVAIDYPPLYEGDPTQGLWWALVPDEIVLCAAADHCLAAAYRGECPGVDPDALMRWRADSRAAFQRRPVEDVLADVERARQLLRDRMGCEVIRLCDGVQAVDMRGCRECGGLGSPTGAGPDAGYEGRCHYGPYVPIAELPEASAREGICFIADGLPGPDGRVKIVCQSGTPEQIEAFMRVWAPAHGLTNIYGDPARGFAGGYQ